MGKGHVIGSAINWVWNSGPVTVQVSSVTTWLQRRTTRCIFYHWVLPQN